jgi:hypothetical protein
MLCACRDSNYTAEMKGIREALSGKSFLRLILRWVPTTMGDCISIPEHGVSCVGRARLVHGVGSWRPFHVWVR